MRCWYYELPFETPSKKNSRITDRRTGRNFPSRQYTEWHDRAMYSLIQQGRPDKPIDYRVEVSGTFIRKDRRRRDNNNSGASILDLLVDAHILADDNDEIVVQERWKKDGIDRDHPVCKVTITEL